MNMQWIFAILILTTTVPVTAADAIAELAKTKAWKNLLHYQPANFGGQKSAIDGQGFFFSPQGNVDAEAEMRASIKAMEPSAQKVGRYQLHPQCAFPVRYRYLKQHLQLKMVDEVCPQLDEFLKGFKNPKSISLVFSSAYINNPASMFGHTFLKINTESGTPLTDIGINYAARVSNDENPFAFVYFGTTGGYIGQWSTENYYAKVREYSQGENRDLWEYEVNLTPQETITFLMHLWEIETNAYFDYYFFDENCSYQILAAIEAIKPEWNLQQHTIYMIPGESLKNLYSQPGIVKSVKLRPSQYRQVAARYQNLNSEERHQFFSSVKNHKLTGAEGASVLETLMTYLDYQNIKKKGLLSADEKALQASALSARAALGSANSFNEEAIAAETRPDLGHDSYSVLISQGVRERSDGFGSGGVTQFKIKSAYHDLMNNDLGYKKYSQLDVMAADIIYDGDLEKVRLNSITLATITSLPPMNFLSYAPAWKFDLGVNTVRDYGCLTCRHVTLEAGVGVAKELGFDSPYLVYAMATVKNEWYRQLYKGFRYGAGFDVGVMLQPTESLKIRLAHQQNYLLSDDPLQADSVQTTLLQASYFAARNWEVRWTTSLIYPEGLPEYREWNFNLGLVTFFN